MEDPGLLMIGGDFYGWISRWWHRLDNLIANDENKIKFIQCKFISNQPSSSDIVSDATKLIHGANRLENNDNSLNQNLKMFLIIKKI